METRRLKNIAILILLLLNAFLLLLMGVQQSQSRQSQSDSAQQLAELFASDELMLSEEIDLTSQPLSPLLFSRSESSESALAAWLLNGQPSAVSEGGGIYSYTTETGTIQFRSGGGFDSSDLALPVSDPEQFVQEFCTEFGFEMPAAPLFENDRSVTVTQLLNDTSIHGCTVTFQFEDTLLVSAAGYYISLDNAVIEDENLLTCTTALVRFLDHRRSAGIVCRQVEDVTCVYTLQSSPSSRRLAPQWKVRTDTYSYFINCITGEVTRA